MAAFCGRYAACSDGNSVEAGEANAGPGDNARLIQTEGDRRGGEIQGNALDVGVDLGFVCSVGVLFRLGAFVLAGLEDTRDDNEC